MSNKQDQHLETTDHSIEWTVDDETYSYWEEGVRKLGFRPWPDHVPPTLLLNGYEHQRFGPILFSYPACSLWHRLIFRLPRRLAWWLYGLRSKGGAA